MTLRPTRSQLAILLAALIGAISMLDEAARSDDARTPARPPRSPRFTKPAGALFADDFSKPALAGWSADQDGVWKVSNGTVRAHLPDKTHQRSFLRTGGIGWTDYAVDVDVCMTRGVDKGVAVRVNDDEGIGVDLRGEGYDDVLVQRGWSRIGKASVANRNGRWHHLRVEARGPIYRVLVNGRVVLEAEDGDRLRGGIALAAYTGGLGKCTVYYDNVVVTPLGDAGGAQGTR